MKLEWGFDEFIPLKAFKDASNGCHVDDTCVFGVEVFVKLQNIGNGECFSVMNATSFKYVWKIGKFPKSNACFKDSDVFSVANHKWYQISVNYLDNQLITSLHQTIFLYYRFLR